MKFPLWEVEIETKELNESACSKEKKEFIYLCTSNEFRNSSKVVIWSALYDYYPITIHIIHRTIIIHIKQISFVVLVKVDSHSTWVLCVVVGGSIKKLYNFVL